MTGIWDDVSAAAVVGTGRASAPSTIPGLALSGTPEERTLDALAVLVTLRTAARPLCRDGFEAGIQSPPDTGSSECGAEAARLLGELLAGADDEDSRILLAAWCRAAIGRGFTVPPSMRAVTGSWLRTAKMHELEDALGAPDMREVAARAFDRQKAWEDGTSSQRALIFEEWRREDPTEARLALETTWASEKVASRRDLLQKLRTGLSLDDEEFLERCLDDRSSVVRPVASELIARIQGSAFERRAEARARDGVRIENGRLVFHRPPPRGILDWRRDDTEVSLHETPEAMAARMVVRAPLRTWSDRPPLEWLHAACAHEDMSAILRAWSSARVDPSDYAREFALARMRLWIGHCPGRYGIPRTWSGIGDEDADDLLRGLFGRMVGPDASAGVDHFHARELLLAYGRRWSVMLSKAVVDWLARTIASHPQGWSGAREVIREVGRYAHAEALPLLKAEAALPQSDRNIQHVLQVAAALFERRVRIEAALAT